MAPFCSSDHSVFSCPFEQFGLIRCASTEALSDHWLYPLHFTIYPSYGASDHKYGIPPHKQTNNVLYEIVLAKVSALWVASSVGQSEKQRSKRCMRNQVMRVNVAKIDEMVAWGYGLQVRSSWVPGKWGFSLYVEGGAFWNIDLILRILPKKIIDL